MALCQEIFFKFIFICMATLLISDRSLYHQQIFTECQTLFWGYDSESIKWMEKLFTKMVKREEPLRIGFIQDALSCRTEDNFVSFQCCIPSP